MISKSKSNKIAISTTVAGIASGIGIGYLIFNNINPIQIVQQNRPTYLTNLATEVENDILRSENNELKDEIKILEDTIYNLREDKEYLTDRIFELENNLTDYHILDKITTEENKYLEQENKNQAESNRKLEEDIKGVQEANSQQVTQLQKEKAIYKDKVNKFEAVGRCMKDQGKTMKIDGKNQKIDWTYCSSEWKN